MTMDDVVIKTGITFLVTVLAAAADLGAARARRAGRWLCPAVLVGLVLGLVISFKTITNPAAILAYAAVEGVLARRDQRGLRRAVRQRASSCRR